MINLTDKFIKILQGKISDVALTTWIKSSEFVYDNDKFIVECPSSFNCDIVSKRYGDIIKEIFNIETGVNTNVDYIVSKTATSSQNNKEIIDSIKENYKRKKK